MVDEYAGKPDWWFPTRYYKGKQKLYKIMKENSPMKTSLYYVAEAGELPINTKCVIPYRLCHRRKKE